MTSSSTNGSAATATTKPNNNNLNRTQTLVKPKPASNLPMATVIPASMDPLKMMSAGSRKPRSHHHHNNSNNQKTSNNISNVKKGNSSTLQRRMEKIFGNGGSSNVQQHQKSNEPVTTNTTTTTTAVVSMPLPPRKSGSWTSTVSEKSDDLDNSATSASMANLVHPKMRAKLASQRSMEMISSAVKSRSSSPENNQVSTSGNVKTLHSSTSSLCRVKEEEEQDRKNGQETTDKKKKMIIQGEKSSVVKVKSNGADSPKIHVDSSMIDTAITDKDRTRKLNIKPEPLDVNQNVKVEESESESVVTNGSPYLDSPNSQHSREGGQSPRRRRLFQKKSPVSLKRRTVSNEDQQSTHKSSESHNSGEPPIIAIKLQDQQAGTQNANLPHNHESPYARNAHAVQKSSFLKLQHKFQSSNLLHNPISRGRFSNYLCIEEDENGGGTIVHIYMEDFDDLLPDEQHTFVKECLREVFAETGGVPHHTMGIVHGGMQHMPNYLEFLAENHPKTTVKVDPIGRPSNQPRTVQLGDYYKQVQQSFHGNTHQAGGLRNISIVGTVQEEHGGLFEDMIESLEENPFLKATLPWGTFSSVHGMHPKDSDDGPILWCRPGEQVVQLSDLSGGGGEEDGDGFGFGFGNGSAGSAAQYRPLNVYGGRRSDKPREKLIEDRTGAHADHAGLPPHRKAIPAVAFLQAVDGHESRIIKDVICFHAADYDKVAEVCGLDYNEEAMDQRIDPNLWFDYAKLNQLRRMGIRYAWMKLRANDIYFIPKGVVHQFRTVSGSISCAWHLRFGGVQ